MSYKKLVDKEKNKRLLRLSVKDVFMAMTVMIIVSTAVISTAFLSGDYSDNKDFGESTLRDSKVIEISTTTSKSYTKSMPKQTKVTATKPVVKPVTVAADFYVNVNYVTYEQLIMIDGLGDALANRIIGFRGSVGEIYDMNELLQIEGIGKDKLALLKRYLFAPVNNHTTITTSRPVTTTASTMTETPVTLEQKPCKVNVNTESASEIARCLCIDMSIAEGIVDCRNRILHYSNYLELLYVEGFTEQMYMELKEYIVL